MNQFNLRRMVIIFVVYIIAIIGVVVVLTPINQNYGLIGMVIAIGSFGVLIYTGNLTRNAEYEHILKTGTEARAKVLKVEETSITMNKQPYVKLSLEIKLSDGTTRNTTVTALVPRLSIPQVGKTIAVKINPENPEQAVLS